MATLCTLRYNRFALRMLTCSIVSEPDFNNSKKKSHVCELRDKIR